MKKILLILLLFNYGFLLAQDNVNPYNKQTISPDINGVLSSVNNLFALNSTLESTEATASISSKNKDNEYYFNLTIKQRLSQKSSKVNLITKDGVPASTKISLSFGRLNYNFDVNSLSITSQLFGE